MSQLGSEVERQGKAKKSTTPRTGLSFLRVALVGFEPTTLQSRQALYGHLLRLQDRSAPSAQHGALSSSPNFLTDRGFVRYLLRGMTEGFLIGFRDDASLRSATRKMMSALQHPEVVQAYLTNECTLSCMLGPFLPSVVTQLPLLYVNRFGVTPKGHNTGKWRLNLDLSYPPSYSVNDGIDPDLCSLKYSTVKQVATVAATYLRGALLATIDIESAYRLIPVHLLDRPLHGMGCYTCCHLVSVWPRRPGVVHTESGCQTHFPLLGQLSSSALPAPPCMQRPWQP